MHLQPPRPAQLPRVLASALRPAEPRDHTVPGVILCGSDLADHDARFARSVGMPAGGTPALLVSAQETANVFAYTDELSLLKSVAALIAAEVHPHLKLGVDALWLVYKAARLRDSWQAPDADRVACLYELGGLALSSASMVGAFYPGLQVPDAWSNGINYVLRSGAAYHQGKTPPVNELLFATDKRTDIPLKLLKLAGISLDPDSTAANELPKGLQRPTLRLMSP